MPARCGGTGKADALFQQFYLFGNRRLGDAAAARRLGEAALLCNGERVSDLPKFHAALLQFGQVASWKNTGKSRSSMESYIKLSVCRYLHLENAVGRERSVGPLRRCVPAKAGTHTAEFRIARVMSGSPRQ